MTTNNKIALTLACFIAATIGFLFKIPRVLQGHDKLLHAAFYFAAAAFLNYLFKNRHTLIFIGLSLFGVLIEYMQQLSNRLTHSRIHGRFDSEDVYANTKGLLLYSGVALVFFVLDKMKDAGSPAGDPAETRDVGSPPLDSANAGGPAETQDNAGTQDNTFFAPQLFIRSGVTDISFYTKAFGAIEHYRRTNDDGTIHVAELSVNGAVFHLHEDSERSSLFSPEKHNSSTVLIGLFVPDVDAIINKAIAAGAELTSPAQDYDYGYRQGEVKDPFGHRWMIEKRI